MAEVEVKVKYNKKITEAEKVKKWLQMPLLFGQYKNEKFGDLLNDPKKKEYLVWLLQQNFLKDSLRCILIKLLNQNKNNKDI